MGDKERGLYKKYWVERINDKDGKHKHCEFFMLDLTAGHDPFVAAALRTYAMGCRAEYPLLAKDLLDIVGKLDNHRIALLEAVAEAARNLEIGEPPISPDKMDLIEALGQLKERK